MKEALMIFAALGAGAYLVAQALLHLLQPLFVALSGRMH